ncbi:MAG TPA: extracellular solute-binding protein [Micromonosporaceae bacterium]
MTLTRPGKAVAALAAAVVTVAGLAACSSSSSKKVYVVGYSVPAPAYTAVGDAFAKTSPGKGVSLVPTFGPSGTEAKAVASGQKADVVNFSTPGDLESLVPSKVDTGWDQGPTKGLITKSVVVIVVHKGNPLGIKGWDDLTKPGVKIVTPVPSTSGSAKWNILAAYEHVIAEGGTAAQANAYLKSFLGNVVTRPASGSEATQDFLNGTGNVLISYESEAILAKQAGKPIDYIVPDQTVLIENPAAVTKSASSQGKAFLTYAESEAGQEIFASKGFRPALPGTKIGTVQGANDPSNPFPTPAHLITVESLGGWDKVNDEFFGDSGISTKLNA